MAQLSEVMRFLFVSFFDSCKKPALIEYVKKYFKHYETQTHGEVAYILENFLLLISPHFCSLFSTSTLRGRKRFQRKRRNYSCCLLFLSSFKSKNKSETLKVSNYMGLPKQESFVFKLEEVASQI